MRPVHTSGSGDRPLSKGGMPPLDPPDGADGSPQIRVLIADDHAMFRAGLRKLLEAEAGFEVVGEAENGLNAMALTRQLAPDVLLLDFAMPGMSGVDVLRELSTEVGATRTVVLTASIAPNEMTDVLQNGAAGVLMKTAATELLYECVRSVASGQVLGGTRHGGIDRGGARSVTPQCEERRAPIRLDAAGARSGAARRRGLLESRNRQSAAHLRRHREASSQPYLR